VKAVPPATVDPPEPTATVHEAFTRANEGETLRDVAIRVYGSPDEADALWRLNRDLVRRRDETLNAGTLLRTPLHLSDVR
jgi:hypothetical protein